MDKMYIDMDNCMNFKWGDDKHCLFSLDELINETKNFIEDDEDRNIEEIEEFIQDGIYEAIAYDKTFKYIPEEFWTITKTIVLYECYKEKILKLNHDRK